MSLASQNIIPSSLDSQKSQLDALKQILHPVIQLPNLNHINQTQFHSSKNQFLTSEFQKQTNQLTHFNNQQDHPNQINSNDIDLYTKLISNQDQEKQQKQIANQNQEKQQKYTSNNKLLYKIKSKYFSITTQYQHFYDPLNQKSFHIKGKRPSYKRTKIKQEFKIQKNIKKIQKQQKPYVQIHQPRNQEYQKQLKQYNEQLRKKLPGPGPGTYNISKSIAIPNFQTIQKNQNILLVKMNHIQGTANFKSGMQKLTAIYQKQKINNPGPGDYQSFIDMNLKSKRQKVKSKLQKYSQEYQSNYKLIFQIFNSQYQINQSLPNFTIKDSSQGSEYNGRPQKLQNLSLKIQRENALKEQKLRKKLLLNAKNPILKNQLQKKRSMSSLSYSNHQKENKIKVFQINAADQTLQNQTKQQKIQRNQMKQKRLQIKNQFNQNVNFLNGRLDQSKFEKDIKTEQKFKILLNLDRLKPQKKQYSFTRKFELYQNVGYYDGSQRQKLRTKYNVKFQKRNQTLKKVLQPIKSPGRMFKSLDTTTLNNQNRKTKHSSISSNQRYNMNMIDLIYNKNMKKRQIKFNELPSSRVSFINTLSSPQQKKFHTIEYQ